MALYLHIHTHYIYVYIYNCISHCLCLLQPRKSSSTPRRQAPRAIQAAKLSSPTTCTCRPARRIPAPATARSRATFDSRIRRRRRLNRCRHRNRRRHSQRRRCATATATRSSRPICCNIMLPPTDPHSLSPPTMPPIRRHPHRTTLCARPPPAWRHHQPRSGGTATALGWHRRPWRQLDPRCACSAVSRMRPDGE